MNIDRISNLSLQNIVSFFDRDSAENFALTCHSFRNTVREETYMLDIERVEEDAAIHFHHDGRMSAVYIKYCEQRDFFFTRQNAMKRAKQYKDNWTTAEILVQMKYNRLGEAHMPLRDKMFEHWWNSGTHCFGVHFPENKSDEYTLTDNFR
jgi:hypothetical protein